MTLKGQTVHEPAAGNALERLLAAGLGGRTATRREYRPTLIALSRQRRAAFAKRHVIDAVIRRRPMLPGCGDPRLNPFAVATQRPSPVTLIFPRSRA